MRLEKHATRARHRARLKLKVGRRSRLEVDIAISSSGLLAIGGLASSILLSTAVIVRTARIRSR